MPRLTNTDIETKLREFHEHLVEERDHYDRVVDCDRAEMYENGAIRSDDSAYHLGLSRAYYEIEELFRLKFLQNSSTDNPS
jgi:hypothetical protein